MIDVSKKRVVVKVASVCWFWETSLKHQFCVFRPSRVWENHARGRGQWIWRSCLTSSDSKMEIQLTRRMSFNRYHVELLGRLTREYRSRWRQRRELRQVSSEPSSGCRALTRGGSRRQRNPVCTFPSGSSHVIARRCERRTWHFYRVSRKIMRETVKQLNTKQWRHFHRAQRPSSHWR